jgi:hypothetical protein
MSTLMTESPQQPGFDPDEPEVDPRDHVPPHGDPAEDLIESDEEIGDSDKPEAD